MLPRLRDPVPDARLESADRKRLRLRPRRLHAAHPAAELEDRRIPQADRPASRRQHASRRNPRPLRRADASRARRRPRRPVRTRCRRGSSGAADAARRHSRRPEGRAQGDRRGRRKPPGSGQREEGRRSPHDPRARRQARPVDRPRRRTGHRRRRRQPAGPTQRRLRADRIDFGPAPPGRGHPRLGAATAHGADRRDLQPLQPRRPRRLARARQAHRPRHHRRRDRTRQIGRRKTRRPADASGAQRHRPRHRVAGAARRTGQAGEWHRPAQCLPRLGQHRHRSDRRWRWPAEGEDPRQGHRQGADRRDGDALRARDHQPDLRSRLFDRRAGDQHLRPWCRHGCRPPQHREPARQHRGEQQRRPGIDLHRPPAADAGDHRRLPDRRRQGVVCRPAGVGRRMHRTRRCSRRPQLPQPARRGPALRPPARTLRDRRRGTGAAERGHRPLRRQEGRAGRR